MVADDLVTQAYLSRHAGIYRFHHQKLGHRHARIGLYGLWIKLLFVTFSQHVAVYHC